MLNNRKRTTEEHKMQQRHENAKETPEQQETVQTSYSRELSLEPIDVLTLQQLVDRATGNPIYEIAGEKSPLAILWEIYNIAYYGDNVVSVDLKTDVEKLKQVERDEKFWEVIRHGFLGGMGAFFLEGLKAYGAYEILFPPIQSESIKNRETNDVWFKKRLQLLDKRYAENNGNVTHFSGKIAAMLVVKELSSSPSSEEIANIHKQYGILVPNDAKFAQHIRYLTDTSYLAEYKKDLLNLDFESNVPPDMKLWDSMTTRAAPDHFKLFNSPEFKKFEHYLENEEPLTALKMIYRVVYHDDQKIENSISKVMVAKLKWANRNDIFWNIISDGFLNGRGVAFLTKLLGHGAYQILFLNDNCPKQIQKQNETWFKAQLQGCDTNPIENKKTRKDLLIKIFLVVKDSSSQTSFEEQEKLWKKMFLTPTMPSYKIFESHIKALIDNKERFLMRCFPDNKTSTLRR